MHSMSPRSVLDYYLPMSRVAKVKNGFAPKVCLRCGLEFEWRKKWAKNWLEVLEGLDKGII